MYDSVNLGGKLKLSLTGSCNLATAAQIGSRIRRTSHPSNLIEGLGIVRTASPWTYEDL
jgi:hypothetical protein